MKHDLHHNAGLGPRDEERDNHSIMQGADIHRVRAFNRSLMLSYVREHGPISRVRLAQHLGLSRTTISSIMDVLLHEGMVREGHFLNPTPKGGRRAILVHFNADVGRVLGIDIGRTHLTMILTNLAAEVVSQRSVGFATERGPHICLPILLSEIRTFVEAAVVQWEDIIGIGVGIPGPLSKDSHRLLSPPHMPGWDNVDIWDIFQQAFHKPVSIDNDANMGALSESRSGSGRGCKDLAYVKIGTGIGCGLLFDSHIYRGHQGSAGELGHLSIDENGPLCVCGNRGCLETLAAAQAIVEDARQGTALAQKQMGMVSEQTPHAHAHDFIDIADVVEAAQRGDRASIAALERAGERIGLALAGLVNLFNPEAIVIDGGVARAGEILLTPLRRVVGSASLPAAWNGTRLLTGELGHTAIALGAALMVLDTAFAVNVESISPSLTENAVLSSTVLRNTVLATKQNL